MLHIYTGNGKGKTTAAVGLAVRANGAGKKVYFFQFLKNGTSSEISELKKLGIETACTPDCDKFTSAMSAAELKTVTAQHNELLSRAKEAILSGKADLIVLDESIGAYNKRLLDTDKASELIELPASSECELVLTGREAPQELCTLADYVTEMLAHKHPYNKGIKARKGIEY